MPSARMIVSGSASDSDREMFLFRHSIRVRASTDRTSSFSERSARTGSGIRTTSASLLVNRARFPQRSNEAETAGSTSCQSLSWVCRRMSETTFSVAPIAPIELLTSCDIIRMIRS